MSDVPVDYRDRLDLHEQLARIDRAREEAQKFTAEQHKLIAEASKLERDRAFLPLTVVVTLLGAGAAIFAAGAGFIKLFSL